MHKVLDDSKPGEGAAPARALHFERAANRHADQIRRLHLAGLVDSGSLSLDPTLDSDLVDVEASYADGYFVLVSYADDPGVVVGMGAIPSSTATGTSSGCAWLPPIGAKESRKQSSTASSQKHARSA
jgi:hypothetical protein